MTMSLTIPTRPQLPIVSKQDPDYDTWKQKGESLVRSFQTTRKALEANQWDIGDWIVQGDERFGEKAYEVAERIIGCSRSYLYTVVWVVKRFPDSSLRKETTLRWSHFKELARIKDEQIREQVFGQVNDGFDHSVRDVRALVERKLKKPKQGMSGKRSKGDPVYLRVPFKPDFRAQIKELANARCTNLYALVRKIVEDYFKENKKEITATVEKYKERRRSKRR